MRVCFVFAQNLVVTLVHRDVIMTSLNNLGGKNRRGSRSRRSTNSHFDDGKSDAAGTEMGSESTSQLPEGGAPLMQRVVLGHRGPGCILGDDTLRERGVIVSVVATSPEGAMALTTSAQRFAASLDAMTQRLFQRLRPQMGSIAELGNTIADAAARQTLVDRCRAEVISQAYESAAKGIPGTLGRNLGSLISASEDAGGGGGGEGRKAVWKRTTPGGGGDGFFSKPLSIEAGERTLAAGSLSSPGGGGGGDGGGPGSKARSGSPSKAIVAVGSQAALAGIDSPSGKGVRAKNLAASLGMPGGVTQNSFADAPSSESLGQFIQVNM